METLVEDYIRNKQWKQALDIYNKLLQTPDITETQIITYLIDRSKCLYELGNYEAVVNDCRNILKYLNDRYDNANESRTRIRLIRTLFILNRYTDAELIIKEWIMLVKQWTEIGEMKLSLINILESFFKLTSKQYFNNWLNSLEIKLPKILALCTINNNNNNNNNTNNNNKSPLLTANETITTQLFCIYCNLLFNNKTDLMIHCQTQEHETMIMSDDGHDWQYRAPPRGLKSDLYKICDNWQEYGNCRYGLQCVEAHGDDELTEWKERFQYREMRLLRAKEKKLYGKSYTEELLEKWGQQTTNPKSVMDDKLDDVDDVCSSPLSAIVTSKNGNHEWVFTLKTKRPLIAVALLQDTYRNHFNLAKISINGNFIQIENNQEWLQFNKIENTTDTNRYDVIVVFQTTIFGTFRQTIVFDFDKQPVLVKHLCVDVVPNDEFEKINDINREFSLLISERWTNQNTEIIQFPLNNLTEWETNLKLLYPCPDINNFYFSNDIITTKRLTCNNYRERMHQLLYVEEIERYNLISRYNLKTKLQLAHSYLLAPSNMASSTAKYSQNGELFATITLEKELSEDTSEGRLILMHCNTCYLYPYIYKQQNLKKVYEAIIEDKGKNMIYLRLSKRMVDDLKLTSDVDLLVQIQFQLNRIPYCEWHYSIDKITNFKLIFPEIYLEPNIPWSPSRQWSLSLDRRLNLKQKEAIVAITTPLHIRIPPILIIGPYGTGKTFTLAQAIKELIKDERNRILLCTHSNSAADLYIKDYLDNWVENGNENARPLRIYYQKRWVATVSPIVQKYCCIKQNGNVREFQLPKIEDIEKHKIIVVTLSTSVYLSSMGIPLETFTHILLDEAAQALECETITPLVLATENTRIVLAGDHMQLGPDVYSKFTKERNFHISLLERLYDIYPNPFSCKILLCQNYRAHETIIQFTSESFYEQKLISSSKQQQHNKFYPLTFFTTRGEDVQDQNSTAFYNNSEVYEVVERVLELKQNWSNVWGEFNDQSIGIVTPYADQVFRIRSELRKRKIDVCVERVLNVQGKQFRAIILSTVRTRRTCTNDKKTQQNNTNYDYGFLSNLKLLNTAITRAQSLVAVVGDPVALCSIGRCSKVWERFIQICNENHSLFGITWTELKCQLDGIELKKIYSLNPLAPEFIPRRYREEYEKIKLPRITLSTGAPLYPTTLHNETNRIFPILLHQPTIHRPYFYNLSPNNLQNLPPPPPPVPPPAPPPTTIKNIFRLPPNPHEIHHPPPPPPPLILNPIPIALPINRLQTVQTAQQQHKLSRHQPKLIQFMNNVHFPEVAATPILNDCVNLLPQNMSLADMMVQPPNIHERWYNYLKETSGVHVAEKFRYLLHTTANQKNARCTETTTTTAATNLFDRTTPLSSSSSSESPTFNWYDSPTNQINFNKPIYLKEVECFSNYHPIDFSKSNPLYNRKTRSDLLQQNENSLVVQNHNNHTNSGGVGLNGTKTELDKQLQRLINEDFGNLAINSNTNNLFELFRSDNETLGSTGPKFYKYFS